MRQAIETKYLGPTNNRGSRVKATSAGGHTLTVEWDCALAQGENHQRAAIMLAEKLGWYGTIQGGGTRLGYIFVFLDCDQYVILPTNGNFGVRPRTEYKGRSIK